MAYIEKRGENTYRLTASDGYNAGAQKRPRKTVRLDEGLTENQREKKLNELAILFDKEVRDGLYLDGERLTFADYALNTWLVDAERNLAPGYFRPCKFRLEERIIPELGNLIISKVKPRHLKNFYKKLAADGARLDTLLKPTDELYAKMEPLTANKLKALTGVAHSTLQRLKRGSNTNAATAEKICKGLGMTLNKGFKKTESKKLSATTIHHHHTLISAIFTAAVDDEVILKNPARKVKENDIAELPEHEAEFYDDEQVADMCVALDEEPIKYKTMIYFDIDTGVRRSELTGFIWSDLDLDNNRASVNRQRQYISGKGIIVTKLKTKSGKRTITLSQTVTDMLKEYCRFQKEALFKIGIIWDESMYVFSHEDGAPFFPGLPYVWFTKFLERHGLPKITFHQLRHSNASLMIAAGVNEVTLAGRLGHCNANITRSIYAHMIKSREKQAANVMDIFYSKPGQKTAKTG